MLRSTQGYSATAIQASAVRELFLDRSTSNQDFIFPQLIGVDGLAGSDSLVDTPILLRYALLSSDGAMKEQAQAIYSGLVGPTIDISTWVPAAAWSFTAACGGSCFNGDYRYGTFFRKATGALTFFIPWSGQSSVMGQVGIFAQGATLDVVP